MSKKFHSESDIGANQPQKDYLDKLEKLIAKVRTGDMDATAQFILRYNKKIVSIAFDVLQDEELAKKSAKKTLEGAVEQLRQNIRTGAFEPWLMWLTRSDALQYTQVKRLCNTQVMQQEVLQSMVTKEGDEVPANIHFTQRSPDNAASPDSSDIIHNGIPAPQSAPVLKRPPNASIFQEERDEFIESNTERQGDSTVPPINNGKHKRAGRRFKCKKRMMQRKTVALSIIISLLCLILLWVLFGTLARNFNGFPDLGYSWFDDNFFELF